MADGSADTIDAASEVIVLAFNLVDSEIPALPGQLAKALESPQVQASIKSTLLAYAKTKSGPGGVTPAAPGDSEKLLAALAAGIQGGATDSVLEQVKTTPGYKKLEASLVDFKKAAASSSLGIWVDKNKGILYVVGAVLVVGASATLYITKTGGPLVNSALGPLKGKEFEVLQVGALTIKASLWDFKPDARIFGARVSFSASWESVKVELKLGVLAKEAEIQQAQGSAMVKSGPLSLTLTGDGKPVEKKYDLGLSLGYSGSVGKGTFTLGLGAKVTGAPEGASASGTLNAQYKTPGATFGLSGNIGPQKGGGTQYGGLLTLEIPL